MNKFRTIGKLKLALDQQRLQQLESIIRRNLPALIAYEAAQQELAELTAKKERTSNVRTTDRPDSNT